MADVALPDWLYVGATLRTGMTSAFGSTVHHVAGIVKAPDYDEPVVVTWYWARRKRCRVWEARELALWRWMMDDK